MENASLPSDVWINATTSASDEDHLTLNLFYTRDLALKIIYIIIGTVGILDNLFVVFVFVFFIKVADKVLLRLRIIYMVLQFHTIALTQSVEYVSHCKRSVKLRTASTGTKVKDDHDNCK